MLDEDIRRATRLLEALLKMREVPLRDLERRLGYGLGMFNRIFSGKVELKMRHILLVLEELEVRPAAFFRVAYEEAGENATTQQLLDHLQRAGLGERPEPRIPVAPLASPQEKPER